MRLQAVDHVVVGLQKHQVLSGAAVPDEDVAAVRAAHHEVSAPEIGFFYLGLTRKLWEKSNQSYENKDSILLLKILIDLENKTFPKRLFVFHCF